jgi:hypothetical protein
VFGNNLESDFRKDRLLTTCLYIGGGMNHRLRNRSIFVFIIGIDLFKLEASLV